MFEALKPILTPEALRLIQEKPSLFFGAVAWLLTIIALCVLCWYISYATGKAYRKPKDKNAPSGMTKLLGKIPSFKK